MALFFLSKYQKTVSLGWLLLFAGNATDVLDGPLSVGELLSAVNITFSIS